MEIIDHEECCWFLLRRDGELFLDVLCSHSAVEYGFLLHLNEAEVSRYSAGGHDYIHGLAAAIQDSAPGVIGNRSPYKDRNMNRSYGHEVTAAMATFRKPS